MKKTLLGRIFLAAMSLAVSVIMTGTTFSQTAKQPSVRPGPDILYAAPAVSPQLENTGVWQAPPIMVSGASAYRKGEFLYQDYLYDDRGAAGRAVYPADKDKFAGNAADFVEVRIKPLQTETAIRITFNSMMDPSLVGTTIALGDSPGAMTAPFGARAKMPAQFFVTVHGNSAEITDAATGKPASGKAAVTVDRPRRQVEVRVPFSVFDPRNKSVRVAAATGLWDPASNAYMVLAEPAPQAGGRGGGGGGRGAQTAASGAPSALFFNVAFRYHEPQNTGNTLAFWSDVRQAAALATGDLSEFYATVDFAKLSSSVTDDSAVPTKGFIDRILVSHFESAQGRGNGTSLAPATCGTPCIPEYAGRLQPYSIYVPNKVPPVSGYGLTLDIHSASANYNRWYGHSRAVDFGERGTGSIVATPNGRGISTWYYGEAEADVFEVWADVARLYKIDPDYVSLAGVSMGGFGGWKIAAQFPDLFAAEALAVPCPALGMPGGAAFDNSFVGPMVPNLRYVPGIFWTGEKDTTCRLEGAKGERETLGEYAKLGLRYDWYIFLTMPHSMSGVFPHWKPMAEYLGMRKRTVDPAHVSYVFNSSMEQPEFGLNANHAYWLSGIANRDSASILGSLDVISHGIAIGDAVPTPKKNTTGVFEAGVPNFPWPNYTIESIDWLPVSKVATSNVIDIKATNVATVTIDPVRAKVSCDAKINVTSDGPIQVQMLGCTKVNVAFSKK